VKHQNNPIKPPSASGCWSLMHVSLGISCGTLLVSIAWLLRDINSVEASLSFLSSASSLVTVLHALKGGA